MQHLSPSVYWLTLCDVARAAAEDIITQVLEELEEEGAPELNLITARIQDATESRLCANSVAIIERAANG